MPTTNKPAPVATGTDPGLITPVTGPVGPLDTAPAPVPAGPSLGTVTVTPDIPVVTTAQAEIATSTTSFVPNTITPNTTRYISISDEGVAVNSQVSNLNFEGSGVSVANNVNGANSVTVTIGGGTTYGNSNVVTLLAGFGSNTISTTGNVTGGNLITSAQVVASGVIQSGTGLSTGGYLSVNGTADLHDTTVTGNLSATGNVTGNYILGNGSQLTGLPATYSNSNVQAYLPTYSGNIGALTVTGNLTVTGTTSTVNTEVVNVSESVVGNIDAGNVRTAGQVSAAGNITGNFFIGNGSTLSSVTGANVSGTVANATYALTSNAATYATQATTADTANAVAGANVSGTVANATYATSAGSATTATTAGTANAVAGANVSGTVANATYALNSNAATYSTQATYANTANAVAGANVSGTVANATYATSAGSATTANTVTDAAQGNITSVGTLTSLSVSGNITAANLGNISSLNLNSNASTVLYGNGTFASLPASSSYGNANVTTLLGNLGSNVISSTGNISTTANISGGYILGNGSQLTSLPSPTVTPDISSTGDMSIMTYDGVIKSVNYATVEPSSGNIKGGNITTTGLVSATGNITAGNISTTGNIIAGNVDTVNLVVNSIASDDSTLVSVQDGLQVYGNIIADNLGNIASINLDGNVSNVLSGTGTWIAAAGGGAANTGNVTFNNQAVVGTGDSFGAGGLYLAPGNTSVGNLQYLRVRGGDVATHIHLDTGNSQYFDQYFGDDGKYVKLASTGNVLIGSNDAVGNTAQWTFDTGGNLTFPTGNLVITPVDAYLGNSAVIASQYHNLITLSTGANGGVSSLWVEDYANASTSNIAAVYTNPTPGSKIVRIAVGQNGSPGPNLWDFDAAGNLAVPGNINFSGDSSAAPSLNDFFSVTSAANFTIVTDSANTDQTWAFDSAGNLSAPGNISAVGNILAGYFVGNGSTLTSVAGANVSGTVANATYATSAGTASTVTTAAQPNITSVGTLTSVAVTGNVTAGGLTVNGAGVVTGNFQVQGNLTYNNLTNITTANLVFGLANTTTGISANGAGFVVGNTSEASFLYNYTAQAWDSNIGISAAGNITGGNVLTGGIVSAVGNVTGAYIIGNGSQLTGVTAYTNANVAAYLPTYTGNVTAGNVTVTANVSGGNVLSSGAISATGNVTAGNVSATNIVGTLTTASQTNITSVGTLGALTVTANVTGGNVLTGGVISSTGNVTGGNIRTAGVISATGNITGGNVSATLLSGTTVSATANVVGGNITTAGVITATGNITGGNISATNHTGTTVSVTGNITGGNIATAGQVSATGNITTANSFVGNLVGTTVSVTGNVSATNVIVNGQPTTYGYVNTTVVANTSPVSSTNFNGGSSVSPSLTVMTLAIPSAGTWRLDAEMRVYIPGEGYMAAGFYDNGTLISGSEYFIAAGGVTQTGAATGQYGGFMSYNLTTAGATTVTMGAWATGTSQFITSDDGRTWARATLLNPSIAVQATATGTLNTDYISVTNTTGSSANYGATGASRDVILDTNLTSQGVTYNTSTGVYTLTAGKTYRITSTIGWYNTTPGYINFNWVDSSTNTAINSITITQANNSWATDQIDPLTADFIYTPVANQSIKMRVYGSSNDTFSIMGGGTSKVVIQQIANTFALNALATMSLTGNVSVGGNLTVTGGIHKSNRIIATTASLTVADAGGFIQFNSGPYTVTLPDPTQAVNAGIGYRFWQNTASNITLSTPAGAFFGPSGTTASTVVLAQATTSYWDVWSDGFNWIVFGIKIA